VQLDLILSRDKEKSSSKDKDRSKERHSSPDKKHKDEHHKEHKSSKVAFFLLTYDQFNSSCFHI
jgi:hypothetical protein